MAKLTTFSMDDRSVLVDYTEQRGERHESFGAYDEKGRAIGAYITTGVHEFRAVASDEDPLRRFWRMPAGRYFHFTPHATRDQRPYGAMQSRAYFTTEAERDAAIAEYLASAKKRAEAKARKIARDAAAQAARIQRSQA